MNAKTAVWNSPQKALQDARNAVACISSSGEIVEPASILKASEGEEEPLPAIREILERLSVGTHDCSFKGHDFELLTEKALEELRPFIIQSEKVAA